MASNARERTVMRRQLHVLLILALARARAAYPRCRVQTTRRSRGPARRPGDRQQRLPAPHRLANPANDARAVAAALWNLGFEVIEVIDADLGQTLAAMTTFASRLRPGMEACSTMPAMRCSGDGANFLLPTSARVGSNADLLNRDRCRRDRPGDGEGRRAPQPADPRFLPRQSVPRRHRRGSSVRGDARPTSRDADRLCDRAGHGGERRRGRHSPYTAALLEHLEEPGLEVATLFRRVPSSVRARRPMATRSPGCRARSRTSSTSARRRSRRSSSPPSARRRPTRSACCRPRWWSSWPMAIDQGQPRPGRAWRVPRAPSRRQLRRSRPAQARAAERAGARRRRRAAPARRTRPVPRPDLGRGRELHRRRPDRAALDLPAGTDPGRLRVRLDQLPGNGVLTLGGNETLVSGDRLTTSMLDELVFQPHIGSRSAQDHLRYTVLDGASEIAHGDLAIAASLHPCDVWAVIRTTRTGSRTACGSSSSTPWLRSPPASGRSSGSWTCRASPRVGQAAASYPGELALKRDGKSWDCGSTCSRTTARSSPTPNRRSSKPACSTSSPAPTTTLRRTLSLRGRTRTRPRRGRLSVFVPVTEASYLIERLVQNAAYDLGIDPVEIRMRNFIKPEQFPTDPLPASSTTPATTRGPCRRRSTWSVTTTCARSRRRPAPKAG